MHAEDLRGVCFRQLLNVLLYVVELLVPEWNRISAVPKEREVEMIILLRTFFCPSSLF